MRKWIKKLTLTSLAGLLSLTSTVAFVAAEEGSDYEGETVKVGVVGDSSKETWDAVSEKAKEEGITIETVLFTDYNQPNQALQDGSIDLNAFQHVAYLDNWNEANGGDLEPIGFTLVTKLALYSDKYQSIEDLPEGAQIAIPNDPTNGGRALLALQIAGLIKVDEEAGILPEVGDITDNPKNIELVELDASQTAASLPDVDAAFINSGYATDAGLSPDKALFVDTDQPDQLSDSYRNVIVARSEDKDNPLYAKVIEFYQTPEIAKIITESSNGGSVPAWEGYQEGDSKDDGETSADQASNEEANESDAESE